MPRILFFMRDALPPFRADVEVLFGKYLPRHGIYSDIIGQVEPEYSGELRWSAGKMIPAGIVQLGILREIIRPFRDVVAAFCHRDPYDLIQVRDKTRTGLLAAIYAKWHKKIFVYWMSYPFAECFELIAQNRTHASSVMKLADYIRIHASQYLLYNWVLPNADHIFVQSQAMQDWLVNKGFTADRMTPVPMGVDMDRFQRHLVIPSDDPLLTDRRVIIHVGLISKARFADFMLDVVVALKAVESKILLVLAGDAISPDEKQWIREAIVQRGVQGHVLLTGWLNQERILPYVVRAEVGLSPYPRGEIEDMSSPTKLVEYMALGLPSVGNDIPDQKLVLEKSGAGICVPMEINAFRDAILKLLSDATFHRQCAEKGPVFVANERAYAGIAQKVADTYQAILTNPNKVK